MLAAEDLVELVPKRGARVAALTGREVRELMELRGMVERYAAERLVAAGRVPLAELRALLDEQRALTGEEETHEFIAVDHRFHASLVSAVGNTLLDRHYDGLRSRQVRAGCRRRLQPAGPARRRCSTSTRPSSTPSPPVTREPRARPSTTTCSRPSRSSSTAEATRQAPGYVITSIVTPSGAVHGPCGMPGGRQAYMPAVKVRSSVRSCIAPSTR